MADHTPELDDRTFQDLVDQAKRLIPQWCPEWTNHGPNDPGIVLLELFAWMTVQVIDRLNEVPERVFDQLLRLIGLEPFPATAASVDVVFQATAPLAEPLLIPAGTAVATTSMSTGPGIEFQTVRDATVGPVEIGAVKIARSDGSFEDVTLAVAAESGISVLDPDDPDAALVLGFRSSCADHVLHLAVDLEVLGIGIDPLDPGIVWEAWSDDEWGPLDVLTDTTAGLHRTGTITLAVAASHAAIDLDGALVHPLRARRLRSSPGPSVTRVLRSVRVDATGAVVPATHSSPMAAELLGTSDGSPGQSFRTSRRPVLQLADGEEVTTTQFGEVESWLQVADFSASEPDDRHFTFDTQTGTVRFGPRVHEPNGFVRQYGTAPPDGAEVRIGGYRVGGGAAGNVGAGTITVLRTEIPFIGSITNPHAAAGGTDAETLDNARRRAPLSLQTGDRAVTATDFERLATWAHHEVARATCDEHDGYVHVGVVPALASDAIHLALDDLILRPDLQERVAEFIDERRMLGTRVSVGPPAYVGLRVLARVSCAPGRADHLVRERCRRTLATLLHPVMGGLEGTGWPFGRAVDGFELAAALTAVDGVDRVHHVELVPVDPITGESHDDAGGRIEIGPGELPFVASVEVRVS